MQTTQKLCADCQHLRIVPFRTRPSMVCAAPELPSNPVTGDPSARCESERGYPEGQCGVSGKLFEQRDPTTWVSWVSRPGPLLDAGCTI